MSSNADKVLAERGATYNVNGTYEDHASLTQELKEACRAHKGWEVLPGSMKESIDMIFHKIARVINGKPDYKDNWDDIEGYARLISRTLEPK